MNIYELFENEYRKYQIALESYGDTIPSESLDALRDIYMPVANMSGILIDLIKERYCHSESDKDYLYPADIIKTAAASDHNGMNSDRSGTMLHTVKMDLIFHMVAWRKSSCRNSLENLNT